MFTISTSAALKTQEVHTLLFRELFSHHPLEGQQSVWWCYPYQHWLSASSSGTQCHYWWTTVGIQAFKSNHYKNKFSSILPMPCSYSLSRSKLALSIPWNSQNMFSWHEGSEASALHQEGIILSYDIITWWYHITIKELWIDAGILQPILK